MIGNILDDAAPIELPHADGMRLVSVEWSKRHRLIQGCEVISQLQLAMWGS